MADRIATVEHALNDVASVGQARAALAAANAELDRGFAMIPDLNFLTVPTEEEATNNLSIYRPMLAAELRLLAPSADDSPIDGATWARTRSEIERVYVEVAGIEGVTGAANAIDVGQILLDAITGAPHVIGQVIGDVAAGGGKAAGGLLGGLFAGAGIIGTLVIIVIVVLILRPTLKGVI